MMKAIEIGFKGKEENEAHEEKALKAYKKDSKNKVEI